RIVGTHLVKQVPHQTRENHCCHYSDSNTGCSQSQPVRYDQSQNIFHASAERHSQSELTRALRNRIRHDRIQTYSRQKESHRAKDGDQHGGKALRVAFPIHLFLDAEWSYRRKSSVKRFHFARQRAPDRARTLARADQKTIALQKVLSYRYVEECPGELELV